MDYERKKKSDKGKKTLDLYGKNTVRGSRFIEAMKKTKTQENTKPGKK